MLEHQYREEDERVRQPVVGPGLPAEHISDRLSNVLFGRRPGHDRPGEYRIRGRDDGTDQHGDPERDTQRRVREHAADQPHAGHPRDQDHRHRSEMLSYVPLGYSKSGAHDREPDGESRELLDDGERITLVREAHQTQSRWTDSDPQEHRCHRFREKVHSAPHQARDTQRQRQPTDRDESEVKLLHE